MNYAERLERAWEVSGSMLCVGLDPDPARLPGHLTGAPEAIFRFCAEIVDATADLACAFKPQIAYFAAARAEDQLERLCAYIVERYPEVVLVLDAKRGDIGPTAEQYAVEAYERYGAHAVTVNPYLGTDAVEPFLAHTDRGVVVLCRTSNAGGDDLQNLTIEGRPLYEHVAELVAGRWNSRRQCSLVVGATYPGELRRVREDRRRRRRPARPRSRCPRRRSDRGGARRGRSPRPRSARQHLPGGALRLGRDRLRRGGPGGRSGHRRSPRSRGTCPLTWLIAQRDIG